MDSADWQSIGTIVAAVGVGGSFWLTWRGQREESRRAHNSAERSENAARLTEEYTSRVVAALELIAANGAANASLAPTVQWSMVHTTGDQFRLTNTGNARAHDVKLTAHESLGGLIDMQGGPDLEAGEALTFMAKPDYDTTDMTITVTWTNEIGEAGQWRYPLPY